MAKELSKLFFGSFYHSIKFNEGLEYFKMAALGVDTDGVIALFRSIDQSFTTDAERSEIIDRELENIKGRGWKSEEVPWDNFQIILSLTVQRCRLSSLKADSSLFQDS